MIYQLILYIWVAKFDLLFENLHSIHSIINLILYKDTELEKGLRNIVQKKHGCDNHHAFANYSECIKIITVVLK